MVNARNIKLPSWAKLEIRDSGRGDFTLALTISLGASSSTYYGEVSVYTHKGKDGVEAPSSVLFYDMPFNIFKGEEEDAYSWSEVEGFIQAALLDICDVAASWYKASKTFTKTATKVLKDRGEKDVGPLARLGSLFLTVGVGSSLVDLKFYLDDGGRYIIAVESPYHQKGRPLEKRVGPTPSSWKIDALIDEFFR